MQDFKTYVKINDNLYPATLNGFNADKNWDNRAVISITLQLTYAEAIALFVNGVKWSVEQEQPKINEKGETEVEILHFDYSDYSIAGAITDNRDGTVTVKMGKPTQLEQTILEYETLIDTLL